MTRRLVAVDEAAVADYEADVLDDAIWEFNPKVVRALPTPKVGDQGEVWRRSGGDLERRHTTQSATTSLGRHTAHSS